VKAGPVAVLGRPVGGFFWSCHGRAGRLGLLGPPPIACLRNLVRPSHFVALVLIRPWRCGRNPLADLRLGRRILARPRAFALRSRRPFLVRLGRVLNIVAPVISPATRTAFLHIRGEDRRAAGCFTSLAGVDRAANDETGDRPGEFSLSAAFCWGSALILWGPGRRSTDHLRRLFGPFLAHRTDLAHDVGQPPVSRALLKPSSAGGTGVFGSVLRLDMRNPGLVFLPGFRLPIKEPENFPQVMATSATNGVRAPALRWFFTVHMLPIAGDHTVGIFPVGGLGRRYAPSVRRSEKLRAHKAQDGNLATCPIELGQLLRSGNTGRAA